MVLLPVVGDLEIRRYRAADAEQVLTVYELALEDHGWVFKEDIPPDEDITDGFLGITKDYLDAGGDFLVGLSENLIIATGGFQPRDDSIAEIRKMAVHPDHQGHGYGERILVELERRAEKRGFDRLVLDTFDRLTAARNLYEKYGYQETRREQDEQFDAERIVFCKNL